MEQQGTFTSLCRDELLLCGIGAGDTVAVLSQGQGHQVAYGDAFSDAARSLGAQTFTVTLPTTGEYDLGSIGGTVGATPLAGNAAAVEALKQADLVVDLVFLLFSPEQLEIQASGTRVLLVVEPPDNLARMFPTPDLRRRVEYGEQLLGTATRLQVSNPHGTDVTYEIGTFPIITEYGYTDTPGRWDHWPGGLVATGAHETGVNGRVVLAPGDIIYPFKTYVQTPIDLRIEDGFIVDISGGLDAELLEGFMQTFDDPKAYGISHIGWGLNERAQWSALINDKRSLGMDGRTFYGNVLFSTGPNTELGGDNDTLCHLDIPMRGCTLRLDDQVIVRDGDIVISEMQAASGVRQTS